MKKIRMKMSNFIVYFWQSIFVRFFFFSIQFNSKNFKSNEKSKRVWRRSKLNWIEFVVENEESQTKTKTIRNNDRKKVGP